MVWSERSRGDAPRSAGKNPRRPGLGEVLCVAGLLLVSILVQSWLVSSKRIPMSSDQAIVCLMAKHILERGEHPVFYYGAAYAGSLEPHYVAGVFAVLGDTPESYRIAMGGLVLLMMIGVYAVTRQAFGRLPAVLALAYLAVPPFFFLYKGLTSDGHYDAFNLFAVCVLLLCLWIERALTEGRNLRALFAGLGFFFGLGWWINPITAPISGAAFAWLFFRKEPRPPIRHVAYLLAGFAVGSAPWTIWNVRHGWVSLASPQMGLVDARRALHNLSEVVGTSLPLLAGGSRLRIGASWDTFPFSQAVVMLVLLALLVPGLQRVVRGDRVFRLFFVCFLFLVLTAIWSQRYLPGEPRLLFPYYVLVPPVIASGFESMSRRRFGRGLAAACGGVLLFAHASSMAVEYRHLENTGTEVTASLDGLTRVLDDQRVRHVYTDYWTAYRLSFESNERIVAAPIPGDEAVRYAPYQEEVARDPSAGIVIREPRDSCLESYLQEYHRPHRRIFVKPFGVFTGLPADVLQFVGEKGGLPLPDEAYRVTWEVGTQPKSVTHGSRSPATVSFRNVSSCSWPHAVHLGYHWEPLEPGLPRVWDGGRALPDRRIDPGEIVRLPVLLKAPDLPGRYSLVYDLVFEQVDFFSTRGAVTAAVPVDVR
jgi:hypothetical protein